MRVFPVAYLITPWPEDLQEESDASMWCATIHWKGRKGWTISRGHGDSRIWLDSNDNWADSEEEGHQFYFPRGEAIRRAAKAIPGIVMSGLTAQEVIDLHRMNSEG